MNMDLQLGLGVLGALATLAVGVWTVMKAFGFLVGRIVAQFELRLDERFAALERAREEGRKSVNERYARMEAKLEGLDRELRQLLIDLPERYVRREDYVRRETVIEAKIDQLGLRLQNWILERDNA